MKLYHYTKRSNADRILNEGLKTSSSYEIFTDLRKDVVFCWLSPNHQKIFNGDEICFEITVEDDRCTVAEMDYISLAMMYKYGGAKYGGKNIPVNEKACDLLVRLYEITALPICEYDDNFFTPEVLVKGNIDTKDIRVCEIN